MLNGGYIFSDMNISPKKANKYYTQIYFMLINKPCSILKFK